jgi:hypothetical protein
VELREAVAAVRERLDDDAVQADGTPGPNAWSDPELIGFFREAQREACERARLIYDDTTPSITQLAVVAAQKVYLLHWSIFDVHRASYNDAGESLTPTTEEALDRCAWADDYGLRRIGRWRNRTESKARQFYLTYTPQQKIKLTTYPIPQQITYFDQSGVEHPLLLQLAVYRYPTWPLMRINDRFEIAAKHHERLIDWVLFRAYMKRDTDFYSPAKAMDAQSEFTRSFGPRNTADQLRREFQREPAQVRGHGI